MGDEDHTSSSQSEVISNSSASNALNKNHPKSKPALLPKPQISASDLRIAKAQIISKTHVSSSAQTNFSIQNKLISPTQQSLPLKKEIVINNSNAASTVCDRTIPPKPPAVSPKPQLPPKSNRVKSEFSTPRVKPEISPKKIGLSNSAPVRPPRSPKRILKNNPFDSLLNKESPTSPSDPWECHKQKSASLARNENLNWTVKELNKNSKTPIRYYQQISKKNERSIVIEDKEAPMPRPRIKNKPKLNLELDLATCNSQNSVPSSPSIESSCPIYATVDYSKKKNKRVQLEEQVYVSTITSLKIEETYYSAFEGFETRRSSDSSGSYKSLVDSHESPERQINATSSLSAVNEIEDYNSNNISNNRDSNHDCNGVDDESSAIKDLENSRNEIILKIEELQTQEPHEKTGEDRSILNNNYSPMNNNYVNKAENMVNNNDVTTSKADCIEERNDNKPSEMQPKVDDVPQSFLHRLVSKTSSTSSAKIEEEEEEKLSLGDKNEPVKESFLHKNGNQKLSEVNSLNSFEYVTMESVVESTPKMKVDNGKLERNGGKDHIIFADVGQSLSPIIHDVATNNTKGSSESLTKLNSSDSENSGIVKRFPFFGSFGKGHKKKTEKKERCASQFYASPSTMGSDADLSERSRAISLPEIRHTGHTPEPRMIRRDENDWNTSIPESIQSGYSEETQNSDSDDDKDSVQRLEMPQDPATKTNKAFLIAKELMTSEEVFIDVLKLLNVDFRNFVEYRNHESKNNVIPVSDLCKILNHLSQLQTLNEDLLADMKERIRNWESNPKIADVIVKKGAFLKMYTSYIQSFESQTNYLDECIAKYPKFGKEVKEFEASERCKKLTIKHYMLKPVQRIPQYRLLLDDYLKHLDENSLDYADTKSALKIVCEVADHANRSMKDGDLKGRLMHYQSLLGDFELIKPGREFIKDGTLEKICRKTVQDRFFILLNDCLLHTTYSKNYLKIHQVLPLNGMKVFCNDEQTHPHSFTVYSITKSFILCAKSESERKDWVDTLLKAIEDYISRQKTFMNVKLPETESFKLGKEAPVWIQDSKVTMCQICTAEFTALFRRHHCRACGRVVCGKCVGNQAPLQYKKFKPEKVCDLCFDGLLKDYEDSEDSIYEYLKEMLRSEGEEVHNAYLDIKSKFIKSTATNSWRKQKFIPPRLKEVSANDSESTISGWLNRRSRKSWKLFWYVLKEHVLYVYKASEDILALDTIPVLGYEVERAEENIEDVDKKFIFSLTHPQQSYVFHAETEESAVRWFTALSTATKFDELPS